MNDSLYERYEKLRDIKGYSDYKVAKLSGIKGTATISNWKSGKYVPKDDKMKAIADVLGVSFEYLKGYTDISVCPVCGFGDNPLSEYSRKEHERFHDRHLKIKGKYDFFMGYPEATSVRENSIHKFRDKCLPYEDRITAYDLYLQSEFSLQIASHSYNPDFIEYSEFCKREVGCLREDYIVHKDLIEKLVEIYGEIKPNEYNYYFDEETAEMAQRIFDSKQLRALFDAAQGASPEDLKTTYDMLMALKRKERGED